jgi:hypothetical protein
MTRRAKKKVNVRKNNITQSIDQLKKNRFFFCPNQRRPGRLVISIEALLVAYDEIGELALHMARYKQ